MHAIAMILALFNDTNYVQHCNVYSRHTNRLVKKVETDKGYAEKPNRGFLAMNSVENGFLRKDLTTAKLAHHKKERTNKISKVCYVVGQY